ncbi:flavodoxin-dependent (E)-4-hydroxy-3-methylbut-2-enyl-diphosphate synthase [Thermosipho ferrireducens]|uniref:4-hydroxy-3-methylbut-2-en-1-yl diphosphate synthase (flavodoxin) n=1 Tax=Thermosipho ferrireducens TaxID=2571116 RepID=A0ABX7SA13_9BACT|nr:flavodoxin-dependent (E)-4-hydroxy-3-methylbut-2-enyl-diphosphate synthase [Thermosipho ferrireducens]QTA38251.1 flavodoxin-dependent (E)-4-hydroxy-3-methylbut-2-enyl-diphosphate synthase [Thermosipho ferrireducens]
MRKEIKIGSIKIGGNNPVVIQSMTNTNTENISATLKQINELTNAGCEIVRVSVPTINAAKSLKSIVRNVRVPIVADIHFDYKIAIESIKNGANKIRINPGNIGGEEKVVEVIKAAKDYGVPIRVGANSGSIPKDLHNLPKVEALCEAALREVRLLEKHGFENIVVSVKSSDVYETIEAYERIFKLIQYPLHVGVTEAGTYDWAVVKSSIVLGYLLMKGIGDTIRVSVAGDPIEEVIIAKRILISLGLKEGIQVIACPTCSRSEFDVEFVAKEIEKGINMERNLKIAVLGCVVNGIGEGKDADIGVAGIKDGAVIFYHGKIFKQVKIENIIGEIKKLLLNLEDES